MNDASNISNKLSQDWKLIDAARLEIAEALNRLQTELTRDERNLVRKVEVWFRELCTLEQALECPDILAFCIPIVDRTRKKEVQTGERMLSTDELAAAIREGYCNICENGATTRQLLRRLMYPIAIFMLLGLLGIGFSFFVVTEFQDIFAEFGIALPQTTLMVFWLSDMVRSWWLVYPLLVLAIACFWFFNRSTGFRRPNNLTWLDQEFMSNRNALAAWTWHVSLLMEFGLAQAEAIQISGQATHRNWLRRASEAWSVRSTNDPAQAIAPDDVHPATVYEFDRPTYLNEAKYQMLNRALQEQPSHGKTLGLRQVASYYWDRGSTIGDWWVEWLVTTALWFVGFCAFVMVLSLFMPLIQLIGGLTGFK